MRALIPWSDSMQEELIRRYPFETCEVIATSLGLTKGQIQQKAYRLGLEKNKTRATRHGVLTVHGTVSSHRIRG